MQIDFSSGGMQVLFVRLIALLAHSYGVIAACEGDRGRRVANERTINFNVSPIGYGDESQLCGAAMGVSCAKAAGAVSATGTNTVSPSTYAVISVPCGILTSFPCMNRNRGAAGQSTIAVATIAPVITPACPPPLVSFTARRFAFSELDILMETRAMSSFPARPIVFLCSASVTVPHAMPPWGTTVIPSSRTGSITSKSMRSPVLQSAEESALESRRRIGVPSSKIGLPSGVCFAGRLTAATGAMGAGEPFASCAKEDGVRMQKTRRRLKHCFTISSPFESAPIIVPAANMSIELCGIRQLFPAMRESWKLRRR